MPLAGGNRRGAVHSGAMPLGPSRRGLVPPFIAMDVLREALAREAAGHSVIHLEVGQPGSPAPQAVLDAARAALAQDRIGYTDALGIAKLRVAIAAHYRALYGVAVDAAEIVVTTGSSAAPAHPRVGDGPLPVLQRTWLASITSRSAPTPSTGTTWRCGARSRTCSACPRLGGPSYEPVAYVDGLENPDRELREHLRLAGTTWLLRRRDPAGARRQHLPRAPGDLGLAEGAGGVRRPFGTGRTPFAGCPGTQERGHRGGNPGSFRKIKASRSRCTSSTARTRTCR